MNVLLLVCGIWSLIAGLYLKVQNFKSFVILKTPIIVSSLLLITIAIDGLGWITLNV